MAAGHSSRTCSALECCVRQYYRTVYRTRSTRKRLSALADKRTSASTSADTSTSASNRYSGVAGRCRDEDAASADEWVTHASSLAPPLVILLYC